jgi:hypothetical protein
VELIIQYYLPLYADRDSIRSGSPGTVPILWVLKSRALASRKSSSGRHISQFFLSHKIRLVLQCIHSDFPTVGESI